MSEAAEAPSPTPPPPAKPLAERLLHVAWLSIAVGLSLELILLLCAALFGKNVQAAAFIAGLAQKVSWSWLVCTGIALGTAASRAQPIVAGFAGLLSAPIAFAVARATHKSVAQALSSAVAAGPSPVLLAALKGAQYAVFGALIAYSSGKTPIQVKRYALVGLGVGVIFGGLMVWVGAQAAEASGQPLDGPGIVSRLINEILFPIGCALVICAADALGRKGASESAKTEERPAS
jgi:hypothetical protein